MREKKQPLGPVLRYLDWISFSIGKNNEKSILSGTDDALESWTTKKSGVSSAKSLIFAVKPSGKSLIYTKKNSGHRIEPCGTPALIFG